MGTNIIQLKPHRTTHTKSDTLVITKQVVAGWKPPPFQRPLRVTEKVRAIVETIRNDGGVIPGVVTLGVLGRDTYLIDGQHRVHAFLLTELAEGYADVRVHHFEDLGAMGDEFVSLNSRLVNFRPDDILRGLEESHAPLRQIRVKCPFVGFDNIRRNDRAPVLSMSALLRCWSGSAPETPTSGGVSASNLASSMTMDEAEVLCGVASLMEAAWGRDEAYFRLWGSLNLTLCLWIYRRTVITQYSPKSTRLTRDMFKRCLMSVSADSPYVDWLLGRKLSDRDRSPAYTRLKVIFGKRYAAETGQRLLMAGPAWSKGHG